MPNLPFFISRRYLIAKKSHNAINIITAISVAVLALGTMALVLILSVFNGLEELIADLYNTVKPDIEITPATGKFFSMDSLQYNPGEDPKVKCWSEVVGDMALIKYSPDNQVERQSVVQIKAVKPGYHCISGIDTVIYDGTFLVEYNGNYFAVLGFGLAGRLGLRLNNPEQTLYFYYPRSDAQANDMMNAFTIETAIPAGVITLQQEEDDKLVYISLDMARKLMNIGNDKASSVELQLEKGEDLPAFGSALRSKLGKHFVVKDRRKLNATIYKITQSEKWSGFVIFSFILLLAASNLVGSITVLIVEKKADIKTLSQMGFTEAVIKKIFLFEGLLISLAGGFGGMLLGFIMVVIQKYFGIIPMEGGFAIDSFPVALRLTDFIYIFIWVVIIGFISTWIPVRKLRLNEL